MTLQTVPPSIASRKPGASALLAAGDRVTIGAEGQRVYRIVHISEQKAWVSPIRDGDQCLIGTGDLRLVQAIPQVGTLLS